MKRKNLDDAISADRDRARSAHVPLDPTTTPSQSVPLWEQPGAYDDLPPKKGGGNGGGTTYGTRCYHSHPPLPIKTPDGGAYVIYGGSASNPAVTDADVYVGFDGGMRWTQRHWPWKKGAEIRFIVPDMGVPDDVTEYRKLLKYVSKQLRDGMKVHCGCIGGHGRTGLFLAALVREMTGEEDAIAYVRENYCERAVESAKQIDFLHKEFGIKKAKATKGLVASGSPGLFDGKQFATGGGMPSSRGPVQPMANSRDRIW